MIRLSRALLVLLVLAATATVGVAPLAAAPAASAPGEILIVTTNLTEAFGERDIRDPSELGIYVSRLLSRLPTAPDVLLLQEVRRSSARGVASRLSNATGITYRVAVDPGPEPHLERNGRIFKRETAIVLNTSTVAKEDAGGFIRLDIPRDEMASGLKPVTKFAALLLVREKATGLQVPVASIHFPLIREFRSVSISNARRGKMARKVIRTLKDRYTGMSPRLDTVGGDFNEDRYIGNTKKLQPFYKAFTTDNGYRDALVVLKEGVGVDVMFTRGGIVEGGIDPRTSDPSEHYSDHRFRWMTLSADVEPPAAVTDLSALWQDSSIALDWSHALDDVAVGKYEVWRKGGDVWRHRATVSSNGWVDPEVYRSKTYTYRVVPIDTSHNWGPASNLAEV